MKVPAPWHQKTIYRQLMPRDDCLTSLQFDVVSIECVRHALAAAPAAFFCSVLPFPENPELQPISRAYLLPCLTSLALAGINPLYRFIEVGGGPSGSEVSGSRAFGLAISPHSPYSPSIGQQSNLGLRFLKALSHGQSSIFGSGRTVPRQNITHTFREVTAPHSLHWPTARSITIGVVGCT